jgi:protein-S-isoprenylcysteine O-methyltransferase Ste14
MAKKLNKTRRRDSVIVLLITFMIILLSKQFINEDGFEELHESFEFLGYFFVVICALGRVYCTAFLGGFKNRAIVDYGPFSVCRNPLYVCTIIGVIGISIISNHIVVMATAPLCIIAIYYFLVLREEGYLKEKFGKEYLDYYKKTPRFIPKFRLYHAPKTVEMVPRTLTSGVKDALLWFIAFPALEFVEYMHEVGWIKPLFLLP